MYTLYRDLPRTAMMVEHEKYFRTMFQYKHKYVTYSTIRNIYIYYIICRHTVRRPSAATHFLLIEWSDNINILYRSRIHV